MIGSLANTLLLIAVAILLIGGQGDISVAVRKIGRYWQQLRMAGASFREELAKELEEDRPDSAGQNTGVQLYYEKRISELEAQLRELQEEIERLRRENGAK